MSRLLGSCGQDPSDAFDCADAFGYGRFQKGVLLFAILSVWVMHAHTLAFPLISSNLDHWCKRPADVNVSVEDWKSLAIPSEGNGQRSHCTVYANLYAPNDSTVVRCKQWDYDAQLAHTTIVSSWDLVCQRRWLLAVIFAVYMAGSPVVLVVGGCIANILGRRLAILGATSVLMLAAFGGCFADTYLMYLSTRFLISGCSSTLCVVSWVLIAEVSTNRHRSLHVSFSGIAGLWLGDACFAVIKDVRLNWIALQLLMVAPTLLLPIGCTFILESPRWLIARCNLTGAETVVIAAAKANGFPARDASAFMEWLKSQDIEQDKATIATATSDAKNILPANVLRRGLVVSATGFSITGVYYVTLLIAAAHKTFWMPWVSLVVDGAFQAAFLTVLSRMEKVTTAIRMFIVAGAICCLLAGIFTSGAPEEYAIVLLIVVKPMIILASILTWLCAVETFPSYMRGLGVCLCYACSRLGGIFASAAAIPHAAGQEDLVLVIAAAALFISARFFQQMPRQSSVFNRNATRRSTQTKTSAEFVQELKVTLKPQPKEKIARNRSAGSGKGIQSPQDALNARSMSLQFQQTKPQTVNLG